MQTAEVCERVWRISEASVRGKSHVEGDLPNQDSVFVATNSTGSVIAAVVSDGAGTALRAREGAQHTTVCVASCLIEAGERWGHAAVGVDSVREVVERGIQEFRDRVQSEGGELQQFHCTLVAWVFAPAGSFIAQIGDSVALSTKFALVGASGSQQIDYFPVQGHTLFEVERGEYANETHFVTEADWKEHLRVSKLDADVDAIVLMTDGAMDIAMLRGEVFRGFLSNLMAKLTDVASRAQRNQVVNDWLDDPKTHRVTGDDKTMLVAIRRNERLVTDTPVFLEQRGSTGEIAQTSNAATRSASVDADVARSGAGDQQTISVRPGLPNVEDGRPLPATAARRVPEHGRARAPFAFRPIPAAVSIVVLLILSGAGVLWIAKEDSQEARRVSLVASQGSRALLRSPAELSGIDSAFEAPAFRSDQLAKQSSDQQARRDLVVRSSSTTFEAGVAHAIIFVRGETVLSVSKMTADSSVVVQRDAPDACREGLQLRAGKACRLTLGLKTGTPPGEYGVDLTFTTGGGQERSASLIVQRVVFEAVADPIVDQRPAAARPAPK